MDMGDQQMFQTIRQAGTGAASSSASDFVQPLTSRAAGLLAGFWRRRRQAHERNALNQLSDEQLKDAGIDRSAFDLPRPTIEVKAGLMANLMSMR
jgi:uncharacterized protein YjiS (DUF1127 family)